LLLLAACLSLCSCNQKCPFCIGHQISEELSPNSLRSFPPKNIDKFFQTMTESNTKKVIFTGTTTDPQLYKYEEQLLHLVRQRLPGIHISLHTNGMLASRKMAIFNQYDTATISLNSFVPHIFQKLHGVKTMPDLHNVVANARIPIKLSCVLTEDNKDSIPHYLESCKRLGIKRITFRHMFGDATRWGLFREYTPSFTFCGNPVFHIDGMEVTYWTFDSTKGKSLNLFADGTLSEDYLLAKAPKPATGSSSGSSSGTSGTSGCVNPVSGTAQLS
jgi:pyruvate-formate lyase-activating enzyme